MIYQRVLGALHGHGWSTVEEVAERAGLPDMAANNTLTELVGQGRAFVRVKADTPDGAVLVYTDEP